MLLVSLITFYFVTLVCFLHIFLVFSAVHGYLMTDKTLAHVSRHLGTKDIILSSVSKVIVELNLVLCGVYEYMSHHHCHSMAFLPR